MAERETTFDVRVWKVSKVPSAKKAGKPGHAYRVRWSVAGRIRSATFPTAALAESERAALMAAARRGEAFDVASGRPVSLLAPEPVVTYSWWEWALAYVDLKWPGLAPNSRLSLAEALTAITMALLPQTPDRPPAADLRKAMMQWAFIVPRRTAGGPPADLDRAVTWLAANAPELSALSDPVVIRSVLDALALKLDRTPAAATTVARKRAVLFNALELAVEQGKLDANPMPRVRWRAPKPAAAIDPACVVNIEQARALLAAVAEVGPLVQPPPRPYPEGATTAAASRAARWSAGRVLRLPLLRRPAPERSPRPGRGRPPAARRGRRVGAHPGVSERPRGHHRLDRPGTARAPPAQAPSQGRGPGRPLLARAGRIAEPSPA